MDILDAGVGVRVFRVPTTLTLQLLYRPPLLQ